MRRRARALGRSLRPVVAYLACVVAWLRVMPKGPVSVAALDLACAAWAAALSRAERERSPWAGRAKASPALVAAAIALSLAGWLAAQVASALVASRAGAALPSASPAFVALAVAFGPLAEELLFRGVVMRRMAPLGAPAATALSSVAFAAAHLSAQQLPAALMCGAWAGLLMVMTGDVRAGLALHAAGNALAIALASARVPAALASPALVWPAFAALAAAPVALSARAEARERAAAPAHMREEGKHAL